MESSMEFLQKLKLELPYDPAILLLNIYLRKMKTLEKICTLPHLLQHYYSSQDTEETLVSING